MDYTAVALPLQEGEFIVVVTSHYTHLPSKRRTDGASLCKGLCLLKKEPRQ